MGKLVDDCTMTQRIAGAISMSLSIIYMAVAFHWGSHRNSIDNDNIKPGFLGGFNKCTLHAVLMVLAMGCCYTQGRISYEHCIYEVRS
jgi:predicted hotdog family 3-hydroxylacyl-ACP dehydratase